MILAIKNCTNFAVISCLSCIMSKSNYSTKEKMREFAYFVTVTIIND